VTAPSEPGSCRGKLDVVQRDSVEGWAQDETDPAVPVTLRVFDNGVPLGDVVAHQHRPDLEAAGIGDGRHAFVMHVPGGLAPDIRHLIEVRRASDGWVLPGSPAVLEASPLDLARFSRQAPAAPWRGIVETATRARLSGWAWDPRTPDVPLALVVLDNGELIARVLANGYRKDLAEAGIGDGRHAFSLHIPGGLSPLTRHVIQVLGEADGREMPTSPVVIEPSTAFDPALEHTVRSAISALVTPADSERVLAFLAATTEQVLQQRAAVTAGLEARLIHRQFERRWGGESGPERAAAAAALPVDLELAPRALVVDERMPSPGDGDATALMSHVSALASLGFAVSFVAAEELWPSQEAVALLAAVGVECCQAPYYASVEEVLRRQHGGFEVIYLRGAGSVARYLALARHHGGRARIVYAVGELTHLRLARQAKVEGRPELLGQSRRVRFAECSATGAADVVITPSSVEAALLRQAVRGANVHVVPWAVPLRASPAPWAGREGIGFTGNLSHPSTVDAAHFLITEIMPRVWKVNPDILCRVSGSRIPREIRQLSAPRVSVSDSAADRDALFDRVRLTVAPLRHGAGVKAQVLESFAAGVPCVMSPLAAEGIGLPTAESFIGRDAETLAAQILRVYEAGDGAEARSQALQSFIAAGYNRDVVSDRLRAALEGQRTAAGLSPGTGSEALIGATVES